MTVDAIAAFFMDNIVYVYFCYGLAFVALGLVVLLESGRASKFRFARALLPLGLFGFLHGAHEWFEMFQIFAAHEGAGTATQPEEIFRIGVLALSFLLLLSFGVRLLPGAEDHPAAAFWQVVAMGLLWVLAVGILYAAERPPLSELLVSADVLARYTLAIPGSLFAAWALLRERRDFHARGMSQYGRALLWAALGFITFGIGQIFTRPSIVFPSQDVNTAMFLRTFGVPIQLFRGLAAGTIAVTLGNALRAFEAESRLRLAAANQMVHDRESRLEELVRQLVTAQEGERQRIARELHDETGQKLSALGMGLAAVDQQLAAENPGAAVRLVRDLRELNDLAITELRNIMADLRPAQLDDLGLIPALRWYLQQYQRRYPAVNVRLAAGRLSARLPSEHETVLFRAAQEALTNIARHAHASSVTVSVQQESDAVCLEVVDDGIGFDLTAPPRHEPGSGLGLVGMHERVALVAGQLILDSRPGHGTCVRILVPAAQGEAVHGEPER